MSPFLRFKGRVAALVPLVGSLFNYAPVCRRVAPILREFKFVFDKQNSAYSEDLVF